MTGNFDWNSDEDIVVERQAAIAVYENTTGDVVIRQEGRYDDEDKCICVRPDNVKALVDALSKWSAR
ncbi:hypothetical protein [Sinorhizobium chiapasense]|uniref:Uncharacterized protein n=1 Tax=Sinorhizobium chiapasense TaxID=501572 RepID=A0ABZ2BET2_9HYPH